MMSIESVHLLRSRVKQVETTMKMFEEFEQGIDHLQLWIDTVERTLEHSIRTRTFQSNELRIHQESIEVNVLSSSSSRTRRNDSFLLLSVAHRKRYRRTSTISSNYIDIGRTISQSK